MLSSDSSDQPQDDESAVVQHAQDVHQLNKAEHHDGEPRQDAVEVPAQVLGKLATADAS